MSALSRRESCIRWSVLVRLPLEIRNVVDDFGQVLTAALLAGYERGPGAEPFNLTVSSGLVEDLRSVASDAEEIVSTWDSSYGETSDQLHASVVRVSRALEDLLIDLDDAVDAERGHEA